MRIIAESTNGYEWKCFGFELFVAIRIIRYIRYIRMFIKTLNKQK